jgi:choline kinase
MKAIILAAGMCKRLNTITSSNPKCLLEFGGQTILEYQIEKLNKYGINDIVVVLGYQRNNVMSKINKNNIRYIINTDYATTNSSYSLWLAKEELINHEFIYLNGDLIFSELILMRLLNNKKEFSCIVDKSRMQKDKDSFKAIMQSSKILEMGKNIFSDIEVPGPFYLNCEAAAIFFNKLDIIIKNNKNNWVYSIFNELSKEITLHGVYTDLPWVEVDTINDYNRLKDIEQEFL